MLLPAMRLVELISYPAQSVFSIHSSTRPLYSHKFKALRIRLGNPLAGRFCLPSRRDSMPACHLVEYLLMAMGNITWTSVDLSDRLTTFDEASPLKGLSCGSCTQTSAPESQGLSLASPPARLCHDVNAKKEPCVALLRPPIPSSHYSRFVGANP